MLFEKRSKFKNSKAKRNILAIQITLYCPAKFICLPFSNISFSISKTVSHIKLIDNIDTN